MSPNVVHDKCDATIFGPTFVCEVNDAETEPKMECIEDCGTTMYICDCNVYRYFSILGLGTGRYIYFGTLLTRYICQF